MLTTLEAKLSKTACTNSRNSEICRPWIEFWGRYVVKGWDYQGWVVAAIVLVEINDDLEAEGGVVLVLHVQQLCHAAQQPL